MADITKTVTICFDPDDGETTVTDDVELVKQYNEFSQMDDCMEIDDAGDTSENSKWILRFEFDQELMLEKDITMDDVHFALKHGKRRYFCIYSDYNVRS